MSISLISTGVLFPDGNVVSSVSVFESGTSAIFSQTTPPTGWTKSLTHNDKALRLVSGSVSTGGSIDFSSCFSNKTFSAGVAVVGGFTTTSSGANLTESQIPSHSHTASWYTTSSGEVVRQFPGKQFTILSSSSNYTTNIGGGNIHNHSALVYSHDHGVSPTTWPFEVQYVDVIIATKD